MSALWDAIESSFLDWVKGTQAPRILLFQGTSAGGGSCSLPGALVGDTVLSVSAIGSGLSDISFRFETTISVADEIQQLTGTPNMSTYCLSAFLQT